VEQAPSAATHVNASRAPAAASLRAGRRGPAFPGADRARAVACM